MFPSLSFVAAISTNSQRLDASCSIRFATRLDFGYNTPVLIGRAQSLPAETLDSQFTSDGYRYE